MALLDHWYGAVLAAALTIAVPSSALARHGADDPAGDVKGEGAGHPVNVARHGADDPAGDVKGEGAGHPVNVARHGADDPAGDVKGEGAGHPIA